ncbi:hypothetical protein HDV03_001214 [Kappamyces sp. JEL0829]|nr:hypothetical protein HDV03_001214 [Kappamyces sp. JEL0829]
MSGTHASAHSPNRALFASQEEQEREPLLSPTDQDLEDGPTTDPKPLTLHEQFVVFLCSTQFQYLCLVLITIVVCKVIVYDLVMPPTIQTAINGQGSIVKHIHLEEISPIKVDISVLIPIKDPKPASASVELGFLTLYAAQPNNSLLPQVPLGTFPLAPLFVEPSASEVWLNSSLQVYDPNFAWLSYTVSQGCRHGFKPLSIDLYVVS